MFSKKIKPDMFCHLLNTPDVQSEVLANYGSLIKYINYLFERLDIGIISAA